MPKGLDYIINIKDGDFGGASKAKHEVEGLDGAVLSAHENIGGLGGAIGKMGLLIGGMFATEKIWEFGKESRAAFMASEVAAAQVSAGIKSTGAVAGRSLDDIRERAEALEKITLFGDENTMGADAILLSFTNIREEILDRATPAMMDFATRLGGGGPADLKGAAQQLGIALNDPIQGLGRLHKLGVEFSNSQKEQIAGYVEHGEIQKAQGIILKELNTEFGGSAEAARKVLGPMGDLDQQTEELKKSFGKLVSEGLDVVVPTLVGAVHGFQEATEWIGHNKDMLIDAAIVLGTGAVAWGVYEGAVLGAGAVTGLYNGYLTVSNGLSAVSLFYDVARAEGMGVLTAAQWALNAAMEANPIGLIITGVGLLVGGIVVAYKHFETFRAVIGGIGEVAGDLVPVFKGLGETILGAFTFNPVLIAQGFKDAYDGVKKVIDSGGISAAFDKGYNDSLAQSKKDALTEAAKGNASTLTGPMSHPAAKPPKPIPGVGGGNGGDNSTSLAGNKSVRNVTMTIGKLVEKIEIHSTSISGLSAADIKRQITELLVGVVHDSELALGT